ncbi:MAG: hypothetical protein ACRDJM_01725 [Actinomycetota bacterium]
MRRILFVLAVLVLMVASSAQATHSSAGCFGATEVLVSAACPVTIGCPTPFVNACLWRLDVSVGGAGIVSGSMSTGDIVWASCGPAPLDCAGVGVFNLPPSGVATLTCAVEGPALLAEYTCSATPMGHV